MWLAGGSRLLGCSAMASTVAKLALLLQVLSACRQFVEVSVFHYCLSEEL